MAGISTSAIQAFFLRLLRPIAKIMLRHGVGYRDLAELCKKVYVAAATDEFGVDGRPANVSRVAMLTGMTRRDVRTVRLSLDKKEEQVLAKMNSATRILSGWHQDTEYCDLYGNPIVLPAQGPGPNFSDLSKRYAGDIPVTVTLKELKNAGAVEEASDGKLVVRTRYFMPGKMTPTTPETMMRSGSVLEDIGSTVDYNLSRNAAQPTRFERRATNLNIDSESIEKFRAFVEEEGQIFLEKIDQWLSDHEVDESEGSKQNNIRLGIGAYWIEGQSHAGAEK